MDGVLRFIFAYLITGYITNRAHKKNSLSNSGRILGMFKIIKYLLEIIFDFNCILFTLK